MQPIGSRMNNNIWLLLAGNTVRLGRGERHFALISVWMAFTAAWHTFRLFSSHFVKSRLGKPALTN